jgi:hypothetical protein
LASHPRPNGDGFFVWLRGEVKLTRKIGCSIDYYVKGYTTVHEFGLCARKSGIELSGGQLHWVVVPASVVDGLKYSKVWRALQSVKKIPPPTPEGHEGRLFPPEQL